MNLASNQTIDKFLEEFENKFGYLLYTPLKLEPYPDRPTPFYSKHFYICPPGDPKYSDWDLGCRANPELPEKKILEMERFIRTFPLFSLQGQLITNLEAHKNPQPIFHHIDGISWLHFMAYLNSEKISPFVDIHVECITNNSLKSLYSKNSSQEYVDWIMITYWRKFLKNKNNSFLPVLFQWLSAILNPQEQKEFINNPNGFIPSYLGSKGSKNYQEIIDYFNKRS